MNVPGWHERQLFKYLDSSTKQVKHRLNAHEQAALKQCRKESLLGELVGSVVPAVVSLLAFRVLRGKSVGRILNHPRWLAASGVSIIAGGQLLNMYTSTRCVRGLLRLPHDSLVRDHTRHFLRSSPHANEFAARYGS